MFRAFFILTHFFKSLLIAPELNAIMPLSAGEKQKRYRERCKDKGNHEEMREKDRVRKNNTRKLLSTVSLMSLRRAERIRKRQARAKMKAETTPQASGNAEHSYKTPQSLGKAVKRASQSLPDSPRKRSRVINTLAKKFAVPTEDDGSSRKGHTKISDEVCIAISTFYCRDDIS